VRQSAGGGARCREKPADWWKHMVASRKAKMVGFYALLALGLSDCAKSPFPIIDAQIEAVKGKPVKTIIDKLGEASGQSQTGNEKTYFWADTLDVGTPFGFQCTIKVFTDLNDKITRYAYDGNGGGCGRFAHALDEKYHRAQGILDF
jgi:hypothetical protein